MYRAFGDASLVSLLFFLIGGLSMLWGLLVPWLIRFVPRRWLYTLGVAGYIGSAVLATLGHEHLILVALMMNMAGPHDEHGGNRDGFRVLQCLHTGLCRKRRSRALRDPQNVLQRHRLDRGAGWWRLAHAVVGPGTVPDFRSRSRCAPYFLLVDATGRRQADNQGSSADA
jgi:hypothetical protein